MVVCHRLPSGTYCTVTLQSQAVVLGGVARAFPTLCRAAAPRTRSHLERTNMCHVEQTHHPGDLISLFWLYVS